MRCRPIFLACLSLVQSFLSKFACWGSATEESGGLLEFSDLTTIKQTGILDSVCLRVVSFLKFAGTVSLTIPRGATFPKSGPPPEQKMYRHQRYQFALHDLR